MKLLPKKEAAKELDISSSATQDTAEENDTNSLNLVSQNQMELQLPFLAKRMFALEYKDDFSLSKDILVNPESLKEIENVESMLGSQFIGIIAKCKIDGCDIHALDNSLNIINHFQINEPISEEFQKARVLACNIDESVIAILVFKKYNILMHINGNLEVVE